MAQSHEDIEKYRELYLLSKEVLAEEERRFLRIDDKASRYFSILTLLTGGYGFLGKWIIDNAIPPQSVLDFAVLALGFLIVVGLSGSIGSLFLVFKQYQLVKLPLNNDVLVFSGTVLSLMCTRCSRRE